MSRSVLSLLILLLEEQGMGWIDWKGYRAQGSTDRPPVSDHSESSQGRTELGVLSTRGKEARPPTLPHSCVFSPQQAPSGLQERCRGSQGSSDPRPIGEVRAPWTWAPTIRQQDIFLTRPQLPISNLMC